MQETLISGSRTPRRDFPARAIHRSREGKRRNRFPAPAAPHWEAMRPNEPAPERHGKDIVGMTPPPLAPMDTRDAPIVWSMECGGTTPLSTARQVSPPPPETSAPGKPANPHSPRRSGDVPVAVFLFRALWCVSWATPQSLFLPCLPWASSGAPGPLPCFSACSVGILIPAPVTLHFTRAGFFPSDTPSPNHPPTCRGAESPASTDPRSPRCARRRSPP